MQFQSHLIHGTRVPVCSLVEKITYSQRLGRQQTQVCQQELRSSLVSGVCTETDLPGAERAPEGPEPDAQRDASDETRGHEHRHQPVGQLAQGAVSVLCGAEGVSGHRRKGREPEPAHGARA